MMSLQRQQGVILVVSLIILLIMSGLAVGLIQQAKREIFQVDAQSMQIDLGAMAESCIEEALAWLEKEGRLEPPCKTQSISSQCGSTFSGNMADWSLGDDNTLIQSKNNAHNYVCAAYVSSSEKLNVSGGAGFEVGKSQGYGDTNTLTKYRYRIASTASSIDGGKVEIEVNVAMVY